MIPDPHVPDGKPATTPDDQFAVVVPVYGEHWRRLTRQIQSLESQVGFDVRNIEVFYVVNNPPDANPQIRKLNQKVLHTLRVASELSRISVHIIDAASKGKEIEGCNVGKARQLGLTEACRHFGKNDRNGWIINTDADSYFDDPGYFRKLLSVIQEHPGAIAFNGGLEFETDPDLSSAKDTQLMDKLYQMRLRMGWQLLNDIALPGEEQQRLEHKMKMSGAHMIVSSRAAQSVGGIPPVAKGEDHAFDHALRTLANESGGTIPNIRHLLTVVTAARFSNRTPGSISAAVAAIDASSPFMATDLTCRFQAQPERLTQITRAHLQQTIDLLAGKPGGDVIAQEMNLLFGRMDAAMAQRKETSHNM